MQTYESAEFPRPLGLLLPAQGPFVPIVASGTTGAWNPSDKSAGISLANSNRDASNPATGNWCPVRGATGKSSGKLYFEIVHTTAGGHDNPRIGFADLTHTPLADGDYLGSFANAVEVSKTETSAPGVSLDNGSGVGFGSGWGTGGAVAGFALDFTAQKAWIALNNVWLFSGDPAAGTTQVASWTGSPSFYPAVSLYYDTGTADVVTLCCNTSNQTYSPPSGFSAWDGA